MANWADTSPDEATAYVTVLTNLRDRDKDAAKMFSSAPTNPEESFIRYNRSTNLFQEYLSAVWTDKVLAIAGGGTGAITAAAARTALGLGTMAVQSNAAVDIDGGDIASAVTINAASIVAGTVAQARLGTGSGGLGQKFLADDQTYKAAEGVLVGTGFLWFTDSAPAGYLFCDGAAVSRSTYSALFAILGTIWGVGDGATTFNLPDLRQRFPLGKAASGTGSTLAGTGGAIDHTHTGPSHTHAAGTLAGPSHTHTQPTHTHTGDSHTHNSGTYTVASHTHSFSDTSSTDSGSQSFSNGTGPGVTVAMDGHTHDVSGTTGSASPDVSGDSGSSGNGTTSASGDDVTGASGTGSVTGSTAAEGTGATGLNNPPYVVVNYIVKY